MNSKPQLLEDDNPEWTEDDFKNAVPFSALPESLQNVLRGGNDTVQVSVDRDIADIFRNSSTDWKTKINNALREWLSEHAV